MKVVHNELCNNVAYLFSPDFPNVDIEGKFQVAIFFLLESILTQKRMVSCKMDKVNLAASGTLILLWYNTMSVQHMKVHVLGHRGINMYKEAKEVNPFFQRNSTISVI
jgi:hypothetical protein